MDFPNATLTKALYDFVRAYGIDDPVFGIRFVATRVPVEMLLLVNGDGGEPVMAIGRSHAGLDAGATRAYTHHGIRVGWDPAVTAEHLALCVAIFDHVFGELGYVNRATGARKRLPDSLARVLFCRSVEAAFGTAAYLENPNDRPADEIEAIRRQFDRPEDLFVHVDFFGRAYLSLSARREEIAHDDALMARVAARLGVSSWAELDRRYADQRERFEKMILEERIRKPD